MGQVNGAVIEADGERDWLLCSSGHGTLEGFGTTLEVLETQKSTVMMQGKVILHGRWNTTQALTLWTSLHEGYGGLATGSLTLWETWEN